ncbi:MAG: hypothetical protein D6794_03515 [Deltaproteobacteria bacterium]|nr:MAG: hypothetical protein D6794_03515 [Deltaproteobacteria bacterium]
MKKIIAGFVLSAAFMATNAMAGPFGLEMGMSLKEIGGKPEKLRNGVYKIVNVPKPHSAFEFYAVKVGPKSGLCWLKAIGKDIQTNSFGTGIKSAFNEMEKKLESIYGKHQRIDVLYNGSIWSEPNEWVMALLKKERVLGAIWEESKGSSLPPNLKQVALVTGATALDKGYIAIEYSFKNEDACNAELAAQEDEAL